jgi:uncharacterized protein (TIGR02391 family)
MADLPFNLFESIARSLSVTHAEVEKTQPAAEFEYEHPFDSRNIHPEIAQKCRKLFDDGHYQETVFKAFKAIEIRVKSMSGQRGEGYSLMMTVFDEKKPILKFNALSTESEENEQRGLRNIFAGALSGVRNPRGHDEIEDTVDQCLDHLSFASYLMRHLDKATKA